MSGFLPLSRMIETTNVLLLVSNRNEASSLVCVINRKSFEVAVLSTVLFVFSAENKIRFEEEL